MAITVTQQDARYESLKKSRNLRWPASQDEYASRIVLCESVEDLAEALQRTVDAGMRPTVRSGGHCYEDFVVNNPDGVILDVSLLAPRRRPGEGKPIWIGPGEHLGDIYLDLYKRYGVTIPAGTCYSVGAGGHISGGGYGLLSRLHGVTSDWLTGIDILTVDNKGKVVTRHTDKEHDPDLFRACRGAGGGNFGIITGFHFDKLPQAPKDIVHTGLSFDWATMTEERFTSILQTYGNYWETRGKEADTFGLFAVLTLSHKSSEHFGIGVQFCNVDGTATDLTILHEFLDRFAQCKPRPNDAIRPGDRSHVQIKAAQIPCAEPRPMRSKPYIEAAVDEAGGSASGRAKYKSTYMKKNFTVEEAKCIYDYLTRDLPDVDLGGFVVAIDSYGGAINQKHLMDETAVWQRSSIMKLQYQFYWQRAEEDAARVKWLKEFYSTLYSGTNVPAKFAGAPYPGELYEGCYINYPDSDMLEHSFWPQLYFGDGDLYPFLQGVKRKYDPGNIFHHAMSIRT
ncbi:FAD-dependent oxidoreductase [Acidicapsa ligni]|uniref:FAD-dependent oxidoreductase n=1 Tax=Acidicapsa ligni TaxID=542300 RepID=UPI0021DFC66E|nr:FAD-binding oxidoreductase [Acidicapsa ligni]